MHKRGWWALLLSVVLVLVLIAGLFLYFSLSGPNYDDYYDNLAVRGELTNPVSGLSVEEAVEQFNETFVYYMLYIIKAYNLHNPPLSFDKPKIELHIGDTIYNAVIDSGKIIVNRGGMEKEDIVIKTSPYEVVRMMQDKNYVYQSFESGESSIELVASRSTLFGKGYLKLYNRLKGEGITGNVIRMYLS